METEELFFDEDMEQIETMRSERKKMKDKDFAKLINKKELSDFEMDEMFLWGKMAYKSSMYQGSASNEQHREEPTRRDFLKLGVSVIGALGTGYLLANSKTFQDWIESRRQRYFKVLRNEGKTYVEFQVEDKKRVFEIFYEKPISGRGMIRLVKSKNPHYIDWELDTVQKLAVQLHQNPILERLEQGKIETISYNSNKTLWDLNPEIKYPVPKEIGRGNLEELVLKK